MAWKGWKAFSPVTDAWKDVRDVTQPEWMQDASTTVAKAGEDAAGDAYNYTTGMPGKALGAVTGSEKVANYTTPPSWDELGKPGEAFYNDFNKKAGVLPPSWRQYAAPATSALLNFVPGVGPLLSAGFTTAYNAGGMQANQKGMDWGKVGVDAAKNFGTAAINMGAKSLTDGAKAAQSAQASGNTMRQGFEASQALGSTSGNTMSAGYNAAMQPGSSLGAGALNAFDSSVDAARAASSIPNTSSTPSAPATYQPTLGDKAYTGAVEAGKGLANNIVGTLAPEGSTALSGFGASQGETGGDVNGYQFGDQLSAFGDQSYMNTPNPTGKRIGADALDAMTMKIGMNNYQQREGARDTSLPAGQYTPDENTPYANQLSNIEQGTNKSYEDLLREVDNYNAYYGIMDANPGMTTDEMNQFIAQPDTQPQALQPYFQGIQPMSMFNTSMIR